MEQMEQETEHKGVDLLQAISNVLLVRNKINENEQQMLRHIQTPQHHSRRIAETLLEYPSLKAKLLEIAADESIKEVRISVKTATGMIKPFWDFSIRGVAQLVLNEH